MKRKSIITIFIVFILSVIILSSFVSAIIGSIGNARMIIRLDVGDTIEKYVLVKNVNDVNIDVELTTSGDLGQDINIVDNEFTLVPGGEKKAYFTIDANEVGRKECKVDVKFTYSDGGGGVGLSSEVIIIVDEKDLEDIMPEDDNTEGNIEENIRENVIPLYECGVLELEDTVYELQNDLTSSGICLIIRANDILIDLNGFAISENIEVNIPVINYPSDDIPPTIELTSPKDNHIEIIDGSSKDIEFMFKLLDSDITYCKWIINGYDDNIKYTVKSGFDIVLLRNVELGENNWMMKCGDSEGNEEFSEIRDLIIKKEEKASSSNDSTSDEPTSSSSSSIDPPLIISFGNEVNVDQNENNEISDSEGIVVEELEIIFLDSVKVKEKKGFFGSIWDWFSGLFS